jgi:hypothetical protein
MKSYCLLLLSSGLAIAASFALGTQAVTQSDPLSSWNDGVTKQAIVEFVRNTTDKTNPNFVAPEARIAAFDQDGTLWFDDVHTGGLLPGPRPCRR